MAFILASGVSSSGGSTVPKRPLNQKWLFAVWPYRLPQSLNEVNKAKNSLQDFAQKRDIEIRGFRFSSGILIADFEQPKVRRKTKQRTCAHKGNNIIVGYLEIDAAAEAVKAEKRRERMAKVRAAKQQKAEPEPKPRARKDTPRNAKLRKLNGRKANTHKSRRK